MVAAAESRGAEAGGAAASPLSRVGCSLLTFHDRGFEDALDRVKAHGFDRIDLAVVPGHCDHVDVLALTPERTEAVAAAIAARGLTVSSINLHPGDMAGADFAVAERRIEASIQLARRLGARVLTLPPGRPAPSPAEWEGVASIVARRIAGFLDRAERAGLTLTIEAPHAHSLAEDVAQAARLFELVGDRRIACTLDTSHLQRGHRVPLTETAPRLGVPVAHVHLRDTLRGEVTVTPGKGDCGYGPFLAALRRDGYAGDLNFELEYEGAGPAVVEGELDFAREHVRRLLAGEPLPFAHRKYQQGWFRVLDDAAWIARHPKEFIIARPRLKAVLRPPVRLAKHARVQWVPYRERRYRSGWQTTWRVGRRVSAISPTPAGRADGLPEKRVAILGCGYTGRYEHGPGFARLPGARVVGVCDVRSDRATFLGDQLRCPSFTDVKALLRDTKPDLVVNCTREWQHHDTTLQSLEAGADVFCEKILAESLASGDAMVRAARERSRVLGVNFNWRFLPGIQRIREIRDGGELGKLRLLRIFAHAWVSHHALDLVRHLGGPVATVSATLLDEPETRGLAAWNDYAHEMLYMPTIYSAVSMQTRDGVGVSLASSELVDPKGLLLSLDAVFQEGTVSLSGILDDDATGTLTASAAKKLDLRMRRGAEPAGFALSFQRSIEAFFQAWRTGAQVPTSGDDALEVMRVENAIVRSHQTGARITL